MPHTQDGSATRRREEETWLRHFFTTWTYDLECSAEGHGNVVVEIP